MKVSNEIRSIEEEMLAALSDQTTAEKSSSKTAKDISETRKKVREEELQGIEIENELAKLQVDILNTGGRPVVGTSEIPDFALASEEELDPPLFVCYPAVHLFHA